MHFVHGSYIVVKMMRRQKGGQEINVRILESLVLQEFENEKQRRKGDLQIAKIQEWQHTTREAPIKSRVIKPSLVIYMGRQIRTCLRSRASMRGNSSRV